MPRAPKSTAAAKKARDTYNWPQDKIDELISEASNPENIRTLLGKKEAGQNTSGDTKVKVYGRIAAKLFPTMYPSDRKLWTRRVQHKWEYLCTQHRTHAKRLRRTGEGLKPDPEPSDDDTASQGIAKIELLNYIPPTGPDHNTPDTTRNIWDEITQKFPQFPRMHELLSTRPNQVPIAVRTAITPSGPITILHQPPSDLESKDAEDVPTDSESIPTPAISSVGLAKKSGKQTVAHPSTQIHAARQVSNSGRSTKNRRLGIEDQFLEIQKQIQTRILERDKHTQMLAERELILKEKAQLLEEFKLGLITPDEYRQAAARLEGGESYSGGTSRSPGMSQPSESPVESEFASLSLA
ncbi:hypothetical protein FRC12_019434 [Ceratobasidium sp. 428]|nr:hypothetical protein FRC12_019434 [Ceratobasidium sp. 428]